SRTGSSPDVAVHVTANAIRGGWLPSPRNIELDESLSITDRFSIRIPNADLARRAGIGDVDFLIVRREADAIGAAQLVGQFFNFPRLTIRTINRHRQLRVGLEPLVVSADAVEAVREPNAAVRMNREVVR